LSGTPELRPEGQALPWVPAPLETARLLLRPLEPSDATRIHELAGTREIADTTLLIPHPYPPGAAESFIARARESGALGIEYVFAVTLRETGDLVGCVGLRIEGAHARGELGYWIGTPYWRRGYATEAARRVVAFAFQTLGLNRVHSSCFTRNSASARVLEKAGLVREGVLRGHVRRFGRFEDLAVYGTVRERSPE
jgi:ribosomal-protein-alanine N-acetyltransferase